MVDFYLIEEFFNAALTLQNRDWAEFFLQVTRQHYPKGVKTMRMLAVFYECTGEPIKAVDILSELIHDNAADMQSVKRLVALYRSMDMDDHAIKLLNEFVELNQDD